MSANPSITPSIQNQCPYGYDSQCSFQALHSPNIATLLGKLQKHHDYIGFQDKIGLLSEIGQEYLKSTRLWGPFMINIVSEVRSCITSSEKELGKMKRRLAMLEHKATNEFAIAHAATISSPVFTISRCKALLIVLASAFISILKNDMCQGTSQQGGSVSDVVNAAFSSSDSDIDNCFDRLDTNQKSILSIKESLYYVAGWHAYTIDKASKRRRSGLKSIMSTVYSNVIIGKEKAKEDNLPFQKVETVELFGGLKYVSREYFMFILRMECVFMDIFTPEKLVMFGSDLISNVYHELLTNQHINHRVLSFVSVDEAADDDICDLIIHMTRTYCRMRGKDFVRKCMQRGFKNKNLGKGIRPTLAIISNPEVRKALKKSSEKVSKQVHSPSINTGNVTNDDNSSLHDDDMHTLMEYTCQLLLDEDFINTDDTNLFQESNI